MQEKAVHGGADSGGSFVDSCAGGADSGAGSGADSVAGGAEDSAANGAADSAAGGADSADGVGAADSAAGGADNGELEGAGLEKAEGVKEQEKDKGNTEYANENYAEAVKAWNRSLQSVKYILDKKLYEHNEDQQLEVHNMELRLCCNIAQAHLKLEEWTKACEMADKALAREPNNAKALYRKACGLVQMLNFREAIRILEKLLTVEPKNAAAESMLLKARRSEQRGEIKSKKMSQRMFSSLSKQRDPRRPPTVWEAIVEFLTTVPGQVFRNVFAFPQYLRGVPGRCRELCRHSWASVRMRWRRFSPRVRRKLMALGFFQGRRPKPQNSVFKKD